MRIVIEHYVQCKAFVVHLEEFDLDGYKCEFFRYGVCYEKLSM